tara:strand:- start:44 stop:199 length:156 start_codon:yes stop_codon:yes gene_type:complete
MDEQVALRIETLETHVARLEGIIHVILMEIESGTIQTSAAEIRKALPQLEE